MKGISQREKLLFASPRSSQRLAGGAPCGLPVLQGLSGPCREPLKWARTSRQEPSFHSPFI